MPHPVAVIYGGKMAHKFVYFCSEHFGLFITNEAHLFIIFFSFFKMSWCKCWNHERSSGGHKFNSCIQFSSYTEVGSFWTNEFFFNDILHTSTFSSDASSLEKENSLKMNAIERKLCQKRERKITNNKLHGNIIGQKNVVFGIRYIICDEIFAVLSHDFDFDANFFFYQHFHRPYQNHWQRIIDLMVSKTNAFLIERVFVFILSFPLFLFMNSCIRMMRTLIIN